LAVRVKIKERGSSVITENRKKFFPATVLVEMPVGLKHLDSDFCWCDPIIELDENGQEAVLHRQVTWN
jgi:hypothetical protein